MRGFPAIVLIGLLLGTATSCVVDPGGKSDDARARLRGTDPYTPAQFAAEILIETNRVRHAHGLPPLEPLPQLDLAADDQARYMALVLTAQHDNALPGQATMSDRIVSHGIRATSAAENVASIPVWPSAPPKSTHEIAAALVDAWMNSPGHRANLLNAHYTHLGASVRIAHSMGAQFAFGIQDFVELSGRPFP